MIFLQTFVRKLSSKFYDTQRVSDFIFNPEGVFDRFSRELALKLACNSGSSQCLFDTSVIVHLFLDPEIDRKVPKGLESVIFCSGMRGVGKQDDFIAMWNKMNNSTDATFRSQAINALGCSDDPTALKDYLQSILGAESSVSYTQAERRSVFSSVLNSKSGLDAIINFMIDFELDIIRSLGYTLENTLSVVARSIKVRPQQTVFQQYLRTLPNLDIDAFNRVSALAENNFVIQDQTPNAEIIEIIRKINAGQETTETEPTEPTTVSTMPTISTTQTVQPTSPTLPTTVPTQPTTVPTQPTTVPTQPTTVPTQPTTAPTQPTTVPTQPTTVPTQPTTAPTQPTTEAPTTPSPQSESTTQGASSISVKIVTLVASIFIAFSIKF